MKNAKKLLALLLAVMMLFSLCACGELKNDDLDGKWTLTFVPAAMGLDEQLSFGGFTPDGTITTKAVFEDGTLEIYTDGIKDWAKDMVDDLYEWIRQDDNIYSFLAFTNGVSEEDFRAQCDSNGATKQVLLTAMEQEMNKNDLEQVMLESLGESKTISKDFEIKDGKLHFDEGAVWTVEVSDDEIVVTKIKGEDGTITMKDKEMVFSK